MAKLRKRPDPGIAGVPQSRDPGIAGVARKAPPKRKPIKKRPDRGIAGSSQKPAPKVPKVISDAEAEAQVQAAETAKTVAHADAEYKRAAARRERNKPKGYRVDPKKVFKSRHDRILADVKAGKLKGNDALRQIEQASDIKDATAGSAAVTVLNEMLRPNRAIAGAADELVKGKGVGSALKAGKRGLIDNKGPNFSKVLEHAGVENKAVRSVAGAVLDVGTDPTTYLTAGTGTAVRKTAESSARAATKKALAAGASKAAADRAGRAAAKKVVNDPKLKNKGVQVGVRAKVPFTDKGIDVKTSGKTTAAISRKVGVSKAATRVRETGPVQAVGKALIHDFRPKGRTPEQHRAFRDAALKQRASETADVRAATRRAKALKKAAPSKDAQARIAAAIERAPKDSADLGRIEAHLDDLRAQLRDANIAHDATAAKSLRAQIKTVEGNLTAARATANTSRSAIKDLPADEQAIARTIQHNSSKAYSAEASRGLRETPFKAEGPDDAQRYLYHQSAEKLKTTKIGPGGSKVQKAQVRGERRPLAVLEHSKPGKFETDLSKITMARDVKSVRDTTVSDYWQTIARKGRPVKRGEAVTLNAGEAVYRVTPRGLEPLEKAGRPDKDAIKNVVEGNFSGRHVVLQKSDVEDFKGRLTAGRPSDEDLLRGYDKAQGFLKTIYTVPNPAYHLRNLYGDSLNAFLADTSLASFKDSARVLESRVVRHRAERAGEQFTGGAAAPKRLAKTVKVGNHRMTHEQILKEAEKHGAIGQGFIGRELEDLTGKAGPITRASQYREDLARLATYLSARKRGLSPAESASWVQKHHFDYGDVTGFEKKVARRVVPFYTFFSRNTRLQTTKVFERPGKYATFGKILNDAAIAAGYGDYDEYVNGLKDYEQRGLPIPIRVDGKVYNAFITPPQTDLNQLTANPGEQLQGLANRVTFFKTIGELALNYSVFFQGQIQDEKHPLVEAPEEVRHLPGFIQKQLGVTHDWINPKTGKAGWAWPAKVDYTIRSLPQGNFALQQLLPNRGTRNQTAAQSRLAFATGVRVTPKDTPARSLSAVKDEVRKLDIKLARLRSTPGRYQDPKLPGHYTREYQRLLDQRKELMNERRAMEGKMGLPEATRLKRRPLTVQEKLRKEVDDFRKSTQKSPEDLKAEVDAYFGR